MLIKILLVADVVLTAALTLLHALKPGWKYTPAVEAVETEVKTLEGQGAPGGPAK